MAEFRIDTAKMALWDDNPAKLDLLGFDTVAGSVEKALAIDGLDPLAIGIHSPWGGGKTTVLELIEQKLKPNAGYLVIRTDPWAYDDHLDVRGTLIAEVINALAEQFKDTADVTAKAGDLMKRISWSRVGVMVAKGAVTMQWDADEIMKAFTPKPREVPESMDGFREAFSEFLDMLPDVKRVVILVDDLDRCLPDAVMATLEAIKLFLSVPKMTFVLAADQVMVRDAIAASLHASGRSDVFADRYLEKIVQLPITLPRLTADETGVYIALLLAAGASPDAETYKAVVMHVQTRRAAGQTPILGDLDQLANRPAESILQLADRLASGISISKASNPRYVKRFLNAFGLRAEIARAHGIELDPEIIAKLYILEDRFPKDFEHFVSLSEADRRSFLAEWESWGRKENETQPENISESTRDWAGTEPRLTDKALDKYLTLAASLTDLVAGAALNNVQAQLVRELAGDGDTVRTAALAKVNEMPTPEQAAIVTALFGGARRADSIDGLMTAVIELASSNPALNADIAEGIQRYCWLKLGAGSVVEMSQSSVPEIKALVTTLASDTTIDPIIREAAKQALAG